MPHDFSFRAAERAYLEPPDERRWTCPDCGEDDIADDVCPSCGYADDDEPDPDRARDERIDREMEDRYGPES